MNEDIEEDSVCTKCAWRGKMNAMRLDGHRYACPNCGGFAFRDADSTTTPEPLSGKGLEPELLQCPKCAFTGNILECFQTLKGLHCRECPDFPEMGPVLLPPKPRPPKPKGRVEFCDTMWRASVGNLFSYFETEKECHQFIAENLP